MKKGFHIVNNLEAEIREEMGLGGEEVKTGDLINGLKQQLKKDLKYRKFRISLV